MKVSRVFDTFVFIKTRRNYTIPLVPTYFAFISTEIRRKKFSTRLLRAFVCIKIGRKQFYIISRSYSQFLEIITQKNLCFYLYKVQTKGPFPQKKKSKNYDSTISSFSSQLNSDEKSNSIFVSSLFRSNESTSVRLYPPVSRSLFQ